MSKLHIIIHAVWSTKNRYPFLDNTEKRNKVWNHIRENALQKEIQVLAVNGYSNHCHILFILNTDITIKKHIQLIKGESSFWINQQNICDSKFEWQESYYAAAVGKKDVEKTCLYIFNQERHHNVKTFEEEYQQFINENSF